MEDLNIKLTDKEKAWLRVYFEANGNATEATRTVYGGSPISCRVKAIRGSRGSYPSLTTS